VTLFISYRREDASGHAGRLHDRLAARFRGARVFMDVDAVPPGTDFVGVISDAVASSDVFIAVIGPRWATDGGALARLREPSDFVRLEIELALQREVPIIPVLVGGADMPPADILPASLQPLALRQAVIIDDRHFHAGCERLVAAILGVEQRRSSAADGQTAAAEQNQALLVPLTIFMGAVAWPAMVAPDASGSTVLALMMWVAGPALGELSRRRSLRPGIVLGFAFPFLPFLIPALALRLGLIDSQRTDVPLWCRVSLAALATGLAVWALVEKRRRRVTPPKQALPLFAVVPMTVGVAIALSLFLR